MNAFASFANAANVLVRALIPIVGVLAFGWSGTKLLVVYFADTAASFYTLMVLTLYGAAGSDTGSGARDQDRPTPGRRVRVLAAVIVLPLPPLLVIGFFFGILPLFVMLDIQSVPWSNFLADRGLWEAIGFQFVLALVLMIGQLNWIRGLDDRNGFFKVHFACLSVRWGLMVLVGFFLSAFIPRVIYGPLLILTYAAATAALELAPAHALTLVGRLVGRADLEGMTASRTQRSAAAKAPSALDK